MDLKVVKLNADYGNNARGEVCSFPAATADALIEARVTVKSEDGTKRVLPGAVYMEKETKAHAEWERKQIALREAEEQRINNTAAALVANAKAR